MATPFDFEGPEQDQPATRSRPRPIVRQEREQETASSTGLAVTSLILGVLATLLSVAGILFWLYGIARPERETFRFVAEVLLALAIVTGLLAMIFAACVRGRSAGGMALAGFWTGLLGGSIPLVSAAAIATAIYVTAQQERQAIAAEAAATEAKLAAKKKNAEPEARAALDRHLKLRQRTLSAISTFGDAAKLQPGFESFKILGVKRRPYDFKFVFDVKLMRRTYAGQSIERTAEYDVEEFGGLWSVHPPFTIDDP